MNLWQIVGGYNQHLNGPGSRMRHSSSGLLEDMTSCIIVLTHSCFEKLTYLPFPVGVIVEAMEEAVDPYTHPLIHGVEGFTLRLLSTVDDQVKRIHRLFAYEEKQIENPNTKKSCGNVLVLNCTRI